MKPLAVVNPIKVLGIAISAGAALGSFGGPVGTAIGAGVGAMVGGAVVIVATVLGK